MTPFTVYDKAGRILRSGMCQKEFIDMQTREGESVIPVKSDAGDYVKRKKVLPRPTMTLDVSSSSVKADSVDEVTITGAAPGTTVTISGPVQAEGVVDAEPVCLTFSMPGAYVVRFELFPYIEKEVVIHAN